MPIISSGKKWRDIFDQTTNLGKQGFSLNAIKDWRTKEYDAGRPSGLQDFYRAHRICWVAGAWVCGSPAGTRNRKTSFGASVRYAEARGRFPFLMTIEQLAIMPALCITSCFLRAYSSS
jgi:hypothetical protein